MSTFDSRIKNRDTEVFVVFIVFTNEKRSFPLDLGVSKGYNPLNRSGQLGC